MKTRIMAAIAATTLALSMGVATAGEIGGAAIMDGASPGYLQQQQQLHSEPGHSPGQARRPNAFLITNWVTLSRRCITCRKLG